MNNNNRKGYGPFPFFAKVDDPGKMLENLKNLAAQEDWNYRLSESQHPYPILYSYIKYTFKRIKQEHDALEVDKRKTKIGLSENGAECCFNTGLFTESFEPIYALFAKNNSGSLRWFLVNFFKESERILTKFEKLPERANYFYDPLQLIYDIRLEPPRVNADHIISENAGRLPLNLKNTSIENRRRVIDGAISLVTKKLQANYKVAVPQFFNGHIQLLVPLVLNENGKADIALAIERNGNVYSGHTCLTLDMAYNNARLIAKPESDWLQP